MAYLRNEQISPHVRLRENKGPIKTFIALKTKVIYKILLDKRATQVNGKRKDWIIK